MFGAKYSRLKFWIISIILFIIAIPILIAKNILKDSVNADTILIIGITGILVSAIWMNTLANRIRDYGDNPWLALFSVIPFANIGLALYYGIAKSNIKEVAQKNDNNSLSSAVYNHSKDIINGIKPAINEYKETHTSSNNNSQNNNISVDESKIYEDIMNEIEQDSKVKSTWAKALSQSDGNKDKAESLYIKLRFDFLIQEQEVYIEKGNDKKEIKEQAVEEVPLNQEDKLKNEQSSNTLNWAIGITLLGVIIILYVAGEIDSFFKYNHSSVTSSNSINFSEKSELLFKADITELVLNLTDSKGNAKLMKLSLSMKSSEPTIAAIVEELKPEIVDILISQISARSSEELLTVGGKNLLKDELLKEINNVINEGTKEKPEVSKNNVKQIFFTTFVIK